MTQEEKMLLIKDLSARLPYAVTVEHTSGFRGTLHDMTVHHMYDDNDNVYDAICYTDLFGDEDSIYIEYFKPYLFPLSSVSEDQKYDFYCRFIKNDCNFDDFKKFLYDGMWRRKLLTFTSLYDIEAIIDWFHKNHIDYRDLIPKGLAIDATGKNIY